MSNIIAFPTVADRAEHAAAVAFRNAKRTFDYDRQAGIEVMVALGLGGATPAGRDRAACWLYAELGVRVIGQDGEPKA